ncbi:MAG: aldo/keto reductase [Candidatus Azobacteroides sp.]|nr:aldo/keto reductase [Candidatus Azobacteroides sp.]
MQYRTDLKSGNKLSIMGFGCMRFIKNRNQIDINRAEQLIVKAVQEGINYFDTAYVYGGSEDAVGQILAKNNLRDKIFLATKLPLGKCRKYEDFDLLFKTQLERLHTDYIDYYLMHNLCDTHLWKTLCDLGIEKWIKEKKESGQIKNVGFSFHGVHDEFLKLLDTYEWDFCQMQYNYININYQAGMNGLKKAAEKGLPVIIMEPLLGGKLATGLPQKAVELFQSANGSLSPAAWGLRWLWNQKEVTVVLSGMNEMAQLEENLETAKDAVPNMLTPEENKIFDSIIKEINDTYKIPCTGCNYCMPCPHNVNIPGCFSAYNASYTVGMVTGMQQYITSTGSLTGKKYVASNCQECGTCEKKCPQHIPIIQSLKMVRKRMEPFWMKPLVNIALKFRG